MLHSIKMYSVHAEMCKQYFISMSFTIRDRDLLFTDLTVLVRPGERYGQAASLGPLG